MRTYFLSFLGRVPESPKEEEEEGPFFARFSDETFLTRCARKKKQNLKYRRKGDNEKTYKRKEETQIKEETGNAYASKSRLRVGKALHFLKLLASTINCNGTLL